MFIYIYFITKHKKRKKNKAQSSNNHDVILHDNSLLLITIKGTLQTQINSMNENCGR